MSDNDTTAGLVVATIMAVREADQAEASRLLSLIFEDATPEDIAFVLTRFAILCNSLINGYAEATGRTPEQVLGVIGAAAANPGQPPAA